MEVVIYISESPATYVTEADNTVIFISSESDSETLVIDQ